MGFQRSGNRSGSIFKHAFKMKKSPKKLQRFGHVIIMDMTRIQRRALELELKGKRRTG
jgi:hypothetical protein